MLRAGGFAGDGRAALADALANGEAYARFERMLAAQGAASGWETRLRPHRREHPSSLRAGFVAAVDALALGEIARELTDRDGSGAGLHVWARTGDALERGRPLATIYGDADCAARVAAAFVLAGEAPAPRPLVYFEIGAGETRSTLDTR